MMPPMSKRKRRIRNNNIFEKMDKRYQWAIIAAIVILLAVGGLLLLSPVEVVEEEIDAPREIDFTTETVFEEAIRELELFKFPVGTDRFEAQEGLVPEEAIEGGMVRRGELIGMRVIMEEMEGTFVVEADVLNDRGREAVALGGRMFPIEVTGGGLFTMCCFETFETGQFYVRVSIDGELAAEAPFAVEFE